MAVPELLLTPSGTLRLAIADGVLSPSLQQAFAEDWRRGLFLLSAEKCDVRAVPTLHYWQSFADLYLTTLCHLPESTEEYAGEVPEVSTLVHFVERAPPMVGGEYLSPAFLEGIWTHLSVWAAESIEACASLNTFLAQHAPRWHQVGRVCFHLAENKQSESTPFAFLATYSTGFGAGNRLKHLPLGKALEQYAGARDRGALVKLLSPINEAARLCPWVDELSKSGAVYRPQKWTISQAYKLLSSVPQLEESGLSIRVPNWWKKRSRPQVAVTIGEEKKVSLGAKAMLDFNVELALGDQKLTEAELEALMESRESLVFIKGQWVEIDRDKLKDAIEHWKGLQAQFKGGEVSFIEGMRLLAGTSLDLNGEEVHDGELSWSQVYAGEGLRSILKGLRDPDGLSDASLENGVLATLRPYQTKGVTWMRFTSDLGLGSCLADDMGLGKTLQVLTLLSSYKQTAGEKPRPSLLVVPASLLGNWKAEAARFVPHLDLLFVHPSEIDRSSLARLAENPEACQADLLVTTYSMVTRQTWLQDLSWHLVILDEAQAIKNPGTKHTKAVKQLNAKARIALTGTPVENRLGDLWSLFDFLNPGLLGNAKQFKGFIKGLQLRQTEQYAPLKKLVGPYILRRMKTDPKIIQDLPDKTETPSYCFLSKQQIALYEETVTKMAKTIRDTDAMKRRGLILQSLMQLKQICNHPSQLTGDGVYKAEESGKFIRLAEICDELAQRQEKVLIFTQFREIIDPLEQCLSKVFGRPGLTLHGGTPIKKRKEIVNAFQSEDGPPFFVLSLKAGGTGLTLTEASHVIHFDRWWNPAVENQATDRAFRIGQKRNVQVHKFITQGTIEEQLDQLIAEKQQLARDVLSSESEVNLTELSDDALMDLVSLDLTRAQG